MSHNQNLEEVLDAFSMELSHDRETLARYVESYPEYKNELIELSFEIRAVENEARLKPEAIDDPTFSSAWNTLQAAGSSSARSTNPFRKFQGKKFASLCKSLGLPKAFVVAIRNRQVEFESLPERFLVAASTALESTLEDLKTFLREPPNVLQTLEFKADKKPQIAQQVTFQELIENTELTDEERKTAVGYLGHDRSN
ncbi:hypothetical protein Mal15_56340 [Stieleria maiorica]|uniref:Uncharacterized protein n=1 Tax=Stieleria maiorica TaxID=2795974 RepID=A0A5B9MNP9_9BACT|nr:hypothetical protein [Stieleria maiorica]QEG01557.1 hypothetical protein Mal15_56340 [Stieleria maiorica]